MKWSIRGNVNVTDELGVVSVINQFVLWRLVTGITVKNEFTFEAWVNREVDKNSMFDQLKTVITGGLIDWHECTHDEQIPQQCVISETYVKG